jgi:hypothetical protein
LLLFSQFAFNTGFYLVVPFLAVHLSSGLGMAGWVVGQRGGAGAPPRAATLARGRCTVWPLARPGVSYIVA